MMSNGIKYSNLDKEIIFLFSNVGNFLRIQTTNFVDKETISYTRQGLDSRNRILGKINYGEEYNKKRSIITTNKDGFFELKAIIKKKYFIAEEMM